MSLFWTDLGNDLADPDFSAAFAAEVRRIVRARFAQEEEDLTREVIAVLQDKGYVVREAEDFQATLAAERERVLAVLAHLRDEEECSCLACIRAELGGSDG